MRVSLVILCFALLSGACNHKRWWVGKMQSHQQIAIQPFEDFNLSDLHRLRNEIEEAFEKKVTILKPIPVQTGWFNENLDSYSADSILKTLTAATDDTILSIIGFTNYRIHTIKGQGQLRRYNEGLFGMGYEPGNASVVSAYRLASPDSSIRVARLKNVMFHELGHNMGLPHCVDSACVMSAANGHIGALSKTDKNYCNTCHSRIGFSGKGSN